MSKTIEDKAQEFAEINEDKKCNYSFSYNKYDIANAFQNGAEFGYSLAENRIKKEYEWKLRWIPVEEKLPEKIQKQPYITHVVQVKSTTFAEPLCAYYNHDHCVWLSYPFGNSAKLLTVTHWRSFL